MPKRRGVQYCVVPAVAAIDYSPGSADCFKNIGTARKELVAAIRDELKECRRRHKRCATVGTARDNSIEIRIGGKQGYHMWTRYGIQRVTR